MDDGDITIWFTPLAVKCSDEATWMRNRAPGVTDPSRIGELLRHKGMAALVT